MGVSSKKNKKKLCCLSKTCSLQYILLNLHDVPAKFMRLLTLHWWWQAIGRLCHEMQHRPQLSLQSDLDQAAQLMCLKNRGQKKTQFTADWLTHAGAALVLQGGNNIIMLETLVYFFFFLVVFFFFSSLPNDHVGLKIYKKNWNAVKQNVIRQRSTRENSTNQKNTRRLDSCLTAETVN